MDLLVRRVRRAIEERHLIESGDRVAVAVSGGADSVALLLVLAELSAEAAELRRTPRRHAPGAAFALAGVIHVHHGLRGAEADADERFVRELAARLGLAVDVCHENVRAEMTATGHSLEAAARAVRYRAFERAADRLRATLVATGHTADDQAETVLLRLLRGTSSRGVAAIRARRGRFVRPLLDCRRAELRRYLERRGQAYREDSSNADEALTRNRLRRQLMPLFEADWPGGVRALARFAELSEADERYLSDEADRRGADAIRKDPTGVQVQVHVERLRALPAPIARRVVRSAIELAGTPASARDVEAVRRLAARVAGHVMLRGLTAERTGDWVALVPGRAGPAIVPAFDLPLPVPGTVEIGETRTRIAASMYAGDRVPLDPGEVTRTAVDPATLALPLRVRSRRAGDRLRPLGAPGTRKLQDVLVDRKVPAAERDAVPLVVDARGRIVWVAGVAVAEAYRVTRPEAGMVILDLKKGTQ